ncbi:hypothetical protein EXN66_Car008834 [Channa argus]|uniref:G-protein coupled receptors family 1 profile domain-containing protein n=1 Tax=Channa argus TaxID=215402 RepID=A0A6G1PT42_CHAAH|nr:hypothetical protein EXN66_Car008834 [Channa argus]
MSDSCCIAVMLHIFASHRQFLDTSRYILFACMLINDTLQFLVSVLLFFLDMAQCPPAWRSDRIWIIILSLWLLSCICTITECSIGQQKNAVDILYIPVACADAVVNTSPIQMFFKIVVNILCFAVVAVIILFTYVRILLETRKLRQDRTSVSKAMHTVLLHGFQLLLCMLAFTIPITETLSAAC